MMRLLTCFLLVGLLACDRPSSTPNTPSEPNLYQGQAIDTTQLLTTIALGSCNRQDLPQDMWQYILQNEPQLWIWLGDNIYGDSEDMEVMLRKYRQQKFAPEYTALREQIPVIGIWDDHDYGSNNAGREYPKKAESQALMLDFLDVPQDAPVRSQEGGFQSYTFGPAGQKVKIILLDSRYFRDAPILNPNRPPTYLPNDTGTILGQIQWEWLEKELRESDAQIHLIGNGIQVIPQDHPYEKWANFPNERARLFNLLKTYQVEKPILLSGDRHIGEVSRIDWEGYPIYELTSSGLTHSYENVGDEPNRHRISKLIGQLNFGLIRIDWNNTAEPGISLELRGMENVLHTTVKAE